MKFMVCTTQHGEGCDYTIGCGMAYDIYEAGSVEEVVEQVVYPDGRDGRCALTGESALREILVIPAEQVTTVDVKSLRLEHERREAKAKLSATEAKEREQLAKLQAKYS